MKKMYYSIDDNYNTPQEAWDYVFENIKYKNKKIWFPFYNDGTLLNKLNKYDFKKIHMKKDFFTYEPKEYDYIVDNPPYSIKEQVFERCKKLNKPFSLLVPIETIERQYFKRIFDNDKKLQILIPLKRYKFEGKANFKRCAPFKSVWICYKMNIPGNQLIYE